MIEFITLFCQECFLTKHGKYFCLMSSVSLLCLLVMTIGAYCRPTCCDHSIPFNSKFLSNIQHMYFPLALPFECFAKDCFLQVLPIHKAKCKQFMQNWMDKKTACTSIQLKCQIHSRQKLNVHYYLTKYKTAETSYRN